MTALAGKVALVTGGRAGIGRAIAEALEAEGARVLTAQRSEGDQHQAIAADLTDPDAPQRIVDEVLRLAGRLDILVNNAGMMREQSVQQTSLQDWEMMLRVNLTAPFLLVRAALPHLIAKNGVIVNVGSVEGVAANPGHAAYCASKAGLHGLTRAIAVDHGPDGVRCNAVAPGWIETDLNRDFVAAQPAPDTFQKRLGSIHPVGRAGKPEEVGALIAWLASPAASFVTGQVWTIDGGRMTQLSLP